MAETGMRISPYQIFPAGSMRAFTFRPEFQSLSSDHPGLGTEASIARSRNSPCGDIWNSR